MNTKADIKKQVKHNESLRQVVIKNHRLHARTTKRKDVRKQVVFQDLLAEGLILLLLSFDVSDAVGHKASIEHLLKTLQSYIVDGVITNQNKFTIILSEIQSFLVKTLNESKTQNIKLSFKQKTIERYWSALEAFRTSTLPKQPKKANLKGTDSLGGFETGLATEPTPELTEGIEEQITKPQKNPWGLVPANSQVEKATGYQLPGEIGKLLGVINPYKYSIVLTGDPHAGKTEVLMQILDAFLETEKTVALFSVEQGGVESDVTQQAIDRNVNPQRKGNLLVSSQAPSFEQLKAAGKNYNVVAVDSWQKLGLPNTRFDELRHECPETIWITIFQQNGEGGTRGGVSADYDSPVILKVHKVDKTFVNNYVEVKKNRGNRLDRYYLVAKKKIHEGYEPPLPEE